MTMSLSDAYTWTGFNPTCILLFTCPFNAFLHNAYYYLLHLRLGDLQLFIPFLTNTLVLNYDMLFLTYSLV